MIHWFKLASPSSFYPLAGKMQPWFWALAAVFGIAGLWISFFVAPTDATQGEGYRIIFVHVPASWMSMFIYMVMATWAGIGLALNARLSGMMAQALAPTGALMAFLSLWTGAFWGKPMWGTWWVWDARLTSELILFFLYLGFIALQAAIDDPRRADKAGAHPGAGRRGQRADHLFLGEVVEHPAPGLIVSMTKAPSMAQTMLWGMLLMALCFWMYSVAMALKRVRTIILEREAHTEWVRELAEVRHELAFAGRILRDGRLCALRVGQLRRVRAGAGARALAFGQAPAGDPAQPAPPCAGRTDGPGGRMKNWKKRGAIVAGGVAAVGIAAALVLNALNSNIASVRHAQRGGRRQSARRDRPSASAAWSRTARSSATT